MAEQQIDPNELAKQLYTVRFENVDRKGWPSLPQDVKNAYIREATEILKRLGVKPAFTRYDVEMAYFNGFRMGVSYASPAANESVEFREMVNDRAREQSDLYLKERFPNA